MNSNQISNRTSSTSLDDDDWGDFVDHSSQIAVGSPKIHWTKPQGAIPLSIFGFEEENEDLGSGALDSGLGFAGIGSGSAKKEGNSINDLMANLYSPSQQINGGSPLKLSMVFDPLNFNNSLDSKSNGSNLNVNGAHSYADRTNFGGDSLNFEANGVKSNGFHSDSTNVGESIEDDGEEVDDFDGWEFKAADSVMPMGDDQKSKVDRKGQEGFNGVAQAFELVINGHNHGGSTVQSNGVVNNIDEWDFGFSLDASSVAQHGVLLNAQNTKGQNDLDNGLNLSPMVQSNGVVNNIDTWDFVINLDASPVAQHGVLSNAQNTKGQNDPDNGLNLSPMVQSNGVVNNIDKWDFGFSLDASPVAQHGVLSNAQNKNGLHEPDNGLNLSPIDRNASTDEHVWGFKDAFSDASDDKLEESKPVTIPPNGVEALVLNGSVDISLFAPDGISHKSSEQQNFDLNFKPNWGEEDGKLLNGNQDGNFHDTGKDLKTSFVNENDDFNENIWDFKSAVTDSGSNNKGEPGASVAGFEAPAFSFSSSQKNLESWPSHQKALPLSIFGDEELETNDDFSTNQGAPTFVSVPHEGLYNKNPSSNISINDLISSLYSQAEKNGSINYSPEENGNGINSSSRMSHSDLGNDDDDESWEFKDASPDVNVPNQTYVTVLGDLPMPSSTELQFDCYMDFYNKLNRALNHVVHGHLENLKKVQSIASLSGEDAKSKAIYEEIQNVSAELSQENLIAENFSSEVLLPRDISFNELFEMLRDPRFQMLDKEYQLSKRLLLAENDLRSAVELLKHVVSTLKILKLVSAEEQSNYVSIWYEVVFVCFQELKHGALIWQESVLRNVESYLLSEPQGKQYICALGEIYRVVQVLQATVKLYKPWILLGYVDSSGLISLLSECSAIWSSSGVIEALCKIDDPIDCKALLDSINFIQNLDEWGLRKHVLSGQQPTCCLSLLSAESIPGLKLVVWNGENYFLKLANLWANLIRRDPPFTRHSSSR